MKTKNHYFNQLPFVKKAELLNHFADFIGSIHTDTTVFELYAYDNAFIEVCQERSNKNIFSIFILEDTDHLLKYCTNLKIDFL